MNYKNKLIYCNILLLLVLVYIINSLAMDPMDQLIFKYLIFNDPNSMLSKYRDYFPIMNFVPKKFDIIIFSIIYILYIPLTILISFIQYVYAKNNYNFLRRINFNIKHPLILSKGMVYNGIIPYFYCMRLNSNLDINTFNKLSWNLLFNENNVPTPKILGTVFNGKISTNIVQDAIIKPITGCCGKGVHIFDKNNIPNDDNYIIQELIKPSHKNEKRSYRIITNTFKNDTQLWDIYLLRSNNIVTNISQGGIIFKYLKDKKIFKDNNNNSIKLSIKEHKMLEKAISNAIKCHKVLQFCPTIGWDIIINDTNAYFLEGNIGVTISCECDNLKDIDYIDFIKPIFGYIMR